MIQYHDNSIMCAIEVKVKLQFKIEWQDLIKCLLHVKVTHWPADSDKPTVDIDQLAWFFFFFRLDSTLQRRQGWRYLGSETNLVYNRNYNSEEFGGKKGLQLATVETDSTEHTSQQLNPSTTGFLWVDNFCNQLFCLDKAWHAWGCCSEMTGDSTSSLSMTPTSLGGALTMKTPPLCVNFLQTTDKLVHMS